MGTTFTGVTNGVTKSDSSQLAQLFSPINALEHGQPYWGGTTGGTSTAYTALTAPTPSSLMDGLRITILPHADCGSSPTLNLNSLGVASIKKDGAALSSGAIVSGVPVDLVYASSAWHVMSGGGSGGSSGPAKHWGARCFGNPTYVWEANSVEYAGVISSVEEYPEGMIDADGQITIPAGANYMSFWVQLSTSYAGVVGYLEKKSPTSTLNVPGSWIGNNGVSWPTTTEAAEHVNFEPMGSYGTVHSARVPVTAGDKYRIHCKSMIRTVTGELAYSQWDIIAFGYDLFA